MASSGQAIFGNLFFSSIINQFTSTSNNLSLDKLIPIFLLYCKRSLPQFAGDIIEKKLIAAGYVKGHPTLYFFDGKLAIPYGHLTDSGMIESDATFLQGQQEQLSSLPAKDASPLLIRAIESCAAVSDNWRKIGGPPDLLLMTRRGWSWLQKNSAYSWNSFADFLHDYAAHKIKVNLVPPATEEQLARLLSAG
jgi:hypothetical protein